MAGFNGKYFAAVRMCRLFWPCSRRRRARVVNIAGAAGRTPDAELPDRRLGQRRDDEFHQGLVGPRQARRRQRQRDPARHDRDRPGDGLCMKQRAAALNISIDEAKKQALAEGRRAADRHRRGYRGADAVPLLPGRAAYPGNADHGRRRRHRRDVVAFGADRRCTSVSALASFTPRAGRRWRAYASRMRGGGESCPSPRPSPRKPYRSNNATSSTCAE